MGVYVGFTRWELFFLGSPLGRAAHGRALTQTTAEILPLKGTVPSRYTQNDKFLINLWRGRQRDRIGKADNTLSDIGLMPIHFGYLRTFLPEVLRGMSDLQVRQRSFP